MARSTSKHPTELELEILKVLWRDGPLTGRQVRDRLAEVRDLAYTTVMTVMGIMEDKGYLKRKKFGKTFIYSPRVTEAATKKRSDPDPAKVRAGKAAPEPVLGVHGQTAHVRGEGIYQGIRPHAKRCDIALLLRREIGSLAGRGCGRTG